MRIAGIETPNSAVGELALRLYRAGEIHLALRFIQESDQLEFSDAERRCLIETIDRDPDGLADLADLRAVLLQPALWAA
jgi:hypothetical protein